MKTTRAKDIILNQIKIEVFLAHNAIGVYIALSDHASTLNSMPFRKVFGTIQRQALAAFILSVCKLYERPSKIYSNYSIPTTLEILREKAPSDLAAEIQNPFHLERFIKDHIDDGFEVRCSDDINKIPDLLLNHFAEHCPKSPPRDANELDRIHEALKVLRDKRVAHHDDDNLDSLSKTDLDGALQLLAFAQNYVNFVGFGLFGFSQEPEVDADKFTPSKSVVWPELNRMIEQLKQVDG